MFKELETREVLKRLSSEGWILRSGKGSHVVATRGTSMVTVSTARRELAIGTYRSIAKVAGWLPRRREGSGE